MGELKEIATKLLEYSDVVLEDWEVKDERKCLKKLIKHIDDEHYDKILKEGVSSDEVLDIL